MEKPAKKHKKKKKNDQQTRRSIGKYILIGSSIGAGLGLAGYVATDKDDFRRKLRTQYYKQSRAFRDIYDSADEYADLGVKVGYVAAPIQFGILGAIGGAATYGVVRLIDHVRK